MAFLRSLFAGVSGLRNHQTMMDVIGNNIANVNTVAFKYGRASFSELYAQTLRGAGRPLENTGGTNPMQVGLGMSVNTLDTIFSQGSIETTTNQTDLAIQGNGFFIVNKGGKQLFTRADGSSWTRTAGSSTRAAGPSSRERWPMPRESFPRGPCCRTSISTRTSSPPPRRRRK